MPFWCAEPMCLLPMLKSVGRRSAWARLSHMCRGKTKLACLLFSSMKRTCGWLARKKLVITQFSDPMMGIAWECEPALQQLVEHCEGQVELRDCMVVLVRDVADFMTSGERALPEAEGIKKYNARLAQIYLSEVPLGGVPINMEGFQLFAPGRRSSAPLCLAYEDAKLVCPEKARAFLMRLREATVLECRPTTKAKRFCG